MKINNKKGMSSILFAMVFAVILSLLAVGFATLLRNDSRQVLDQTLGYQAQYAAESGINQAIEAIKASPSEQTTCKDFNLGDTAAGDDAKVTCVTWEKAPDVQFSDLTNEPQPFKIQITGSGSAGSLVFEWKLQSDAAVNGGSGFNLFPNASRLPNNITNNNMPIIKLVLQRVAPAETRIFYLVPINGGGSGNYSADGTVYGANCGASPSLSCSFTLGNIDASFNNGYMSISTIGRTADDVLISTSSNEFDGVQWNVDSTAIALDITKRVQARVNPIGATWRPGNAVSTNEICKDIKVDSINNVGISGSNACADRLDD